MMSMSLQEAVSGMPPARRKKTRRGGRKAPSGKPGAQHHSAMNQAYAQGNYAQAKTHALNFANAMHAHVAGASGMNANQAPSAGMQPEPDADDMGGPSDHDADNAPEQTNRTTGVISESPDVKRTRLAMTLKKMRTK